MAASLLYSALDSSVEAAVDFKSAKTTTATVVRTARSLPGANTGPSSSHELFTVCFVLDRLDQIKPADLRAGYEEAERQRLGTFGPRCEVTGNDAVANLRTGDKVQVVYLLANGYDLSVARIESFGSGGGRH
jgi:hypothetical protein